ncbi:hypothetical protein H0H92_004849 [Tricholoma furcatifolium]|nr:hypothetical protein H0H92_004849 [Tricholoma furcatifolium]
MAVAKLLNLFALSSIAILAFSYGATPVNALSIDSHNLAARSSSHAVLAKKKRSTNSKRCKARPAPSSSSSSSSVAKPTSTSSKPAATSSTKKTSTAAAAATQAASSSSSGSSSTPGGPGKVGIGWPQDDNTALAYFKTDKVSPIYTWSPYYPDVAKQMGFTPCAMLWGQKQVTDFANLAVEGYATCAMGFNEPNQQGQSNMDYQTGANLWKEYIQPLKEKGYALISPAPTNDASGTTWLENFFGACTGCTFDALAIHYYGTDPQDMISYLEGLHSQFGLPIWVTEYACENFSGGAQCTMDEVWTFMETTQAWMDATDYIQHYFFFGAMYDMGNVNPDNQLLGSNGQPTDLGWYYISN